jgi:outer membrane cobalamin receptor
MSAFVSLLRMQGSGNYNYRLSEDDGNEEFTRNLGETLQRKNSDITRDQFFAKLMSENPSGLWCFNVSADNSERGMPGYIAPRLTPLARQKDRRFTVGGEHSVKIGLAAVNSRINHSGYRRDFSDPDPFSFIHEAHESGSQSEAESSVEWKAGRWNANAGSRYRQSVLRSDQLVAREAIRNQFAVWSGGAYRIFKIGEFAEIRSRGGIRLETFEANAQWLPQFGISADIYSSLRYHLDGNFSKSYRAPDLYALFWAEDYVSRGNPNLLPEQSSLVSTRAVIETPSSCVTKLELFATKQNVTNLIYWKQAFDGHWMPFNLKAAEIASFDIELSQKLPYHFDISAAVNWLEARDATDDRTTGGKYLTFRPPRTHRAGLNFMPGKFHFAVNYRWVAARPVLDTNFKWLSSYSLVDVSCSYRMDYSHLTIKPSLTIFNAADETYRIIRYAPMPQREFAGAIHLIYTP